MKFPIHAELIAAFAARDAARVAGLYAEDAMFFTPGRAVAGRSAILEVMTADFEDPGFDLELHEEQAAMSSSGDLAYTRGNFRASFTDPGSRKVEIVGGNYLQIFRRKPDESWEIVEDISSPGGSEAGPGAPERGG